MVDPAPGLPRSLDLLAGAIATPNLHELADLATDLPSTELPGPPGPGAAATALARHTGGVIVVTLGADGALVADPGRSGPGPTAAEIDAQLANPPPGTAS